MQLQTKDYKLFQLMDREFNDFRQANHCLPGDIVEWIDSKCQLVKRAKHRFIPGVLELKSKYVYGHTSRGAKIYLFHPHDRKYPPFRVGSNCRDTNTNQLGLVEFMDWEEFESMPRGNLIRLLGPCGDLDAERKALTYQYGNPQLSAELFDIEDIDIKERIKLEGFTFNIDPDDCLDIDDVFTLERVSEKEWNFIITIADVGAHIVEGSEGDKHAYHLGQTLYQNGEAVVPMFPTALSEMTFSLRKNEKHFGVSLFCRWNTESKQLEIREFQETIFLNNATYTYDTVYTATEFPLHILQDIASFLHGSTVTDSHDWVAECMILYNKQVAKKLVEHNIGILRTHKPADQQRLEQFTALHPDLSRLAYESAKYEPTGTDKVHATLGSVPYCHATSPIRRYADLINQRCLKAILNKKSILPSSLELTKHLNAIQKRMKAYERNLFFLEQIAQQTTGSVEGLVFSSTKVYIPSWKQLIKLDVSSWNIGQQVQLDYYADLQKPHWDQRMVFRINTPHENERPDKSSIGDHSIV